MGSVYLLLGLVWESDDALDDVNAEIKEKIHNKVMECHEVKVSISLLTRPH